MRYLVAISLVFLFTVPCFAGGSALDKMIPAVGGANAFFSKAGPVKVGITASWPIVTYKDWKFYLDGLIVESDVGAGISTDVLPIASLLNFEKFVYPVLPIEGLIKRTAVGLAVVSDGDEFIHDGGVYLKTSVLEYKF